MESFQLAWTMLEDLGRPGPDTLFASRDVLRECEGVEFGGIRLVPLRDDLRVPKWPDGMLRRKPWWLSDDAWAEHRQWVGDFFGWERVAFLMDTSALMPTLKAAQPSVLPGMWDLP